MSKEGAALIDVICSDEVAAMTKDELVEGICSEFSIYLNNMPDEEREEFIEEMTQ